MRILRIAGSNLASLAGPFELDLSAAPLSGAGLFAITGETGAGKSTLLDALSLALYGEYPRSGAGGQEAVPDPGGQDLAGSDPRVILRRGTASGYAEADFVGVDGCGYRARWAVRRAGQRPDGRLQEVARALTRVADGSPVESGKTAVRAAVERLTRLTYPQFARAVILPQGEFDKFLLAPERERAELLERITGTQIYAAISARVHEETETRRRALELLRDRRNAVPLLSEADREAAEAEAAAARGAAAALATRRAALAAQISLASRIAEAAAAAQDDAEALRLRRAEADALAPERAMAQRAAAADLASPEARAAEDAGAVLALAETALAEAGHAAEDARVADAEANAALPGLAEAEATAHRDLLGAAPALAEAERMEAAISAMEPAVGEARRLAAASEVAAAAADQALAHVDARVVVARRSLDDASARLARNPERARLATEREAIPRLCADRARVAAERTAAASALELAEAFAASSRAEVDARRDAVAAAGAERAVAAAELESAMRAVALVDFPVAQARMASLATLAELVEASRASAALHAGALAEAAGAVARGAAAAVELRAARTKRETSDASRAASVTARARAAELADLAEGAASREAAHLRSVLVDGAPCPVCGGLDHPHAGRDGDLAAVAEGMRRHRQELDAAIREDDAAIADATTTIARTEWEFDASAMGGADARVKAAGAAAAHGARLDRMSRLRGGLGILAPVPEGIADEASARALAALASEVSEAADVERAALDAHSQARDEADRLRSLRDGLVSNIEGLVRELTRAVAAAHAADIAVEKAGGLLREIEARLAGSDALLAPILAAAGIEPDEVEGELDAARDRIIALADEHARLIGELAACGRLIEDLARERAGALFARDRAMAEAAGRLEAAVAREGDLASLRQARVGKLQGEATAAYRMRHEEALDDARSAHAAARERCARTSAEAAVTGRRLAACITAAELAGAAATAAGAALSARCEGLELTLEEALRLLAIPTGEREEVRGRIEASDRALAAAEVSTSAREKELQVLRAGQAEADDGGGPARLEAIDAEMAEAHRRSGAVSERLAENARQRLVSAELDVGIDTAAADHAIWRDVHEAVGSAGGDMFRRFAQEVTVEHLVSLANLRLEAIAPRYRLTRGNATALAIHAVDLDMGGEVRAARSLSGGERFLVSLALALGLAGLEGDQAALADVLFIDEGFGSLDAESLDVAVDALEALRGLGRRVGVITHVQDMVDRIAVRVRVSKRGAGRSVVSVQDGGRPVITHVAAP